MGMVSNAVGQSNVQPNVKHGKLFTVQGNAGTQFADKHGALSMLAVDGSGKFAAKLTSNKQQLVFDIRQTSVFTIDGHKINLTLPENVNQARYIVSYDKKTDGELSVSIKMDVQTPRRDKRDKQDTQPLIQRTKFKTLVLSTQEKKQPHNLTVDGQPAQKSASYGSQVDAHSYLQYKLRKAPNSSQKGVFDTNWNGGKSSIIDSRGELISNGNQSKSVSIPALVGALDADQLEASFKDENIKADAAQKIDQIKETMNDNLGACKSWDEVAEVADAIAVFHGKPNYTQDVDTYLAQFTSPNFQEDWDQAGFDVSSLKNDIKILAKLLVLGEAKNPVSVMRGGKLTTEQRQKYLAQIPKTTLALLEQKLPHLPKIQEYKAAIQDQGSLGTAGLLLRSIAAMDQPRSWRINNPGCNETGAFLPDALTAELNKDVDAKNLDKSVADAMINIFRKIKGLESVAPPAGMDEQGKSLTEISVGLAMSVMDIELNPNR
jgi:hypothetical protein